MLRKSLLRIKYIVLLFIVCTYAIAYAQPVNIPAQEAKKMIDSKDYGLILDVRTMEEYTGELGHIDGAVLIPVQELKDRMKEIEKFKDKKVIVVCHSGVRSRKASDLLMQSGFKKVFNIADGMVGWDSQKYPVKR
ncbi:MAG: rhodanese-like domain-containing protein [Nitrospinae bacterium]|nr:rhodanese-like domain-containing protein [Nitrospinota bacterium]